MLKEPKKVYSVSFSEKPSNRCCLALQLLELWGTACNSYRLHHRHNLISVRNALQ